MKGYLFWISLDFYGFLNVREIIEITCEVFRSLKNELIEKKFIPPNILGKSELVEVTSWNLTSLLYNYRVEIKFIDV